MSGVLVVGAGGHAKSILAALETAAVPIEGLLDDDPARLGTTVIGYPILGPTASLAERGRDAVMAIGDNRTRNRLVAVWGERVRWLTVVHPTAVVHKSACLGPGSVVLAGAIVQPDAKIGAHAIINTSATVDHDCSVSAFAHIAPGVYLAGAVCVGEGALVGLGTSVAPGKHIGGWAVVGTGSVVVRDVAQGTTVYGNPARPS